MKKLENEVDEREEEIVKAMSDDDEYEGLEEDKDEIEDDLRRARSQLGRAEDRLGKADRAFRYETDPSSVLSRIDKPFSSGRKTAR